SMLPMITESTFTLSDRTMGINYGLNKLRFTSPVPAGSRIRGRFTLAKLEKIEGGVQTTWNVVVARDGAHEPVLIAETISRHYRSRGGRSQPERRERELVAGGVEDLVAVAAALGRQARARRVDPAALGDQEVAAAERRARAVIDVLGE